MVAEWAEGVEIVSWDAAVVATSFGEATLEGGCWHRAKWCLEAKLTVVELLVSVLESVAVAMAPVAVDGGIVQDRDGPCWGDAVVVVAHGDKSREGGVLVLPIQAPWTDWE